MYHKIKTVIILLLLISISKVEAQWLNNPAVNTRLVSEVVNPKNVSAIEDLKGGAFIFWEDNKSGQRSDIYFLHINADGKPDFRTDGKSITPQGARVSTSNLVKQNPVALTSTAGNAVVMWKESNAKTSTLYLQKVSSDGSVVWPKDILLSEKLGEIKEYGASGDKNGNTIIAYIVKEEKNQQKKIIVQKIAPFGFKYFVGGITLHENDNNKINPQVIVDGQGGAYVLWLETIGSHSVLQAQHIDSTGFLNWGKKPLSISALNRNTISYNTSVSPYGIYIAWQAQGQNKDVYHQFVSVSGKTSWTNGGKLITNLKGNQINPQVIASDTSLFVCWTNEVNNNKDIYIQKFSLRGIELWKDEVPVIKLKGDQFGQKILSDGKEGTIVTWLDKRDSGKAAIYAQRIGSDGSLLWDAKGVPVATNQLSEKSYINILSDDRGGAIVIFKENRKKTNEIYGQKIFNSGSYQPKTSNFDVKVVSDSIRISWQSQNETGDAVYEIERSLEQDPDNSGWVVVGKVAAQKGTNHSYEYYDLPVSTGAIYYRIVELDKNNNITPSEVKSINFIKESSNIIIGQNVPNPFKGTTKIVFYLPQAANVRVEFFNSRIEKLSEVSDYYQAGENFITFDGKNLAPGIYFYRFQIGKFTDVKKMILTN